MQVEKVKIKMRGINQLMRSKEVQAVVDKAGNRIANAAGEGFTYTRGRPHKWTARGYVGTSTQAARLREARQKVLLSALSAGRSG